MKLTLGNFFLVYPELRARCLARLLSRGPVYSRRLVERLARWKSRPRKYPERRWICCRDEGGQVIALRAYPSSTDAR